MAIPAERIKEAILHSNPDVRQAAAAYFARAGQPDPAVMPLIIQAIDCFGWEHAFSCYWFMDELPQNEATVEWLLGQLESMTSGNDGQRVDTLLSSLTHAPPALLQKHSSRINAIPWLSTWARDAIERRMQIAATPPDELWQELQEFCQEHEQGGVLCEDELEWANQAAEVLGGHANRFGEQVLQLLRDRTDDTGYWTLTLAVQLAGRMRLESASPAIIELLSDEGVELVDACHDALIEIGGEGVVARLVELFPSAGWERRMTIAAMLEDFHTDQAVHVCLALARSETDFELRAQLLQSALRNFDAQGIEPARQFVLETPLDPDVVEVRQALLTACTLLGADFPELAAWREAARDDEAFCQRWYEEHGFVEDEDGWYRDEGDSDYAEDEFDDDDYAEDRDVRPVPHPDTYVHVDPHVGRNDPCPCGSGKKFKKCCLRKSGGRLGL